MNTDDRLTSRLLAGRDELSRIEKDRILDAALPSAPKRLRWVWLAVPALAAMVLFIVAPWKSHDDFTARGGNEPVGTMQASCTGGCARGGKLLFDLHGTTGYRYFAAFARRGDGPVLWYFPTTDGATSIAVPANGVVDRGIVIGPEHAAGTYRVFGVFSAEPLTRAQLRDRFDPAHLTAGPGAQVRTTEVEIR